MTKKQYIVQVTELITDEVPITKTIRVNLETGMEIGDDDARSMDYRKWEFMNKPVDNQTKKNTTSEVVFNQIFDSLDIKALAKHLNQ